jgi:hypothetical protein
MPKPSFEEVLKQKYTLKKPYKAGKGKGVINIKEKIVKKEDVEKEDEIISSNIHNIKEVQKGLPEKAKTALWKKLADKIKKNVKNKELMTKY